MHTLEQLNAFIAVYELGSYSSASKRLGKSRTTVREQVLAYEDTLGYSLFTINGRKAVPSDKAEQLYFHAKVVEKQNRELFCYSQAMYESDIHTINVVYDVIVPLKLMAKVEQRMRTQYPMISVNWLHRTRQEALDMLQQGSADFALMPNREMVFSEADVTWVNLGPLHLKCYVGKGSPLLENDCITVAHLQNETQYITENFLMMDVGYVKVSPKMQVVSNNDLLCELIKLNGWAAMPEEYMRDYLKTGELFEIRPKELSDSKLISLNVYFPIGKDNKKVFSDTINWIVELSQSVL